MDGTVQAGSAEQAISALDLSTSHELIESRPSGRRQARKVCEVALDDDLVTAQVKGPQGLERRTFTVTDVVVVRRRRGR